jgi:hypothetical protein
METIIIHPTNEAQQKALKTILDGLNVPYENEPPSDATEYLLSSEANKKWLDSAMTEAKKGKGIEIKTEDLWK